MPGWHIDDLALGFTCDALLQHMHDGIDVPVILQFFARMHHGECRAQEQTKVGGQNSQTGL